MTFSTAHVFAAVVHNELPMPAFMYGVVTLIIFVILGVAAWSYRDVANRHSHKFSDQTHDTSGDGHGH